MAALASDRGLKPTAASVRRATVIASRALSPGFQRVTIRIDGDDFRDEFRYLGYDQWFRLFLPAPDHPLRLPDGPMEGWYARLLEMPDDVRPTVRNYTIRSATSDDRGWCFDVDFVLHRSATGELEGEAAQWAVESSVGDEVGFLDQGRIFRRPATESHLLIVSDETGLPGIEAIAASAPDLAPVTTVIEHADAGDVRRVGFAHENLLVRPAGETTGDTALAFLDDLDLAGFTDAYIVGEGTFVLAVRSRLLAAGIAKVRIDFCAYWRRGRERPSRRRPAASAAV